MPYCQASAFELLARLDDGATGRATVRVRTHRKARPQGQCAGRELDKKALRWVKDSLGHKTFECDAKLNHNNMTLLFHRSRCHF
jgi:hypothetical protein